MQRPRQTKGDEDKGPTNAEPEDSGQVRRRCKNTLLASLAILSKPGLQSLAKLVMCLLDPVYSQHSKNVGQHTY